MKLDIQKFAVSKNTSFSESNLNTTNNTSSLTITIYFSAGNNVTYFSSNTLYCTCNGVTQSATVSHPKGGSVTKSFTFNNIQHNADGSKTVSWSWNCNTGTSVLGNISDSGNRALTTLHKPPLVTAYTITETNQDLIDIGIANNVFVANLSKKSINITYELYDNATLLRASLYNGSNQNFLSNTLPFVIDFTQNPLYVTEDGVPIYVRITDSNNSATYYSNNGVTSGRINPDFYNYINYVPISLTSNTTIAKRLGQISGRVGLNINGVYYNGVIGNVDQTSYKPIIKYKFWKYGDSEPSTYAYTIPANDITISNGTFSVSDYDIGSTIETDTNYFNPEFAYRIKIYVEDNITNNESSELQIQVGEPVWSEYPNRVDFKKLTIQGDEVKPTIYSLDETDTGKIWEDGKKIYRKVYKLTSNLPSIDTNSTFDISDLDIDHCTDLDGWTYSSSFGRIDMNFYNNGSYNYLHMGYGNLTLNYRYHWLPDELYFIIEYTKNNI